MGKVAAVKLVKAKKSASSGIKSASKKAEQSKLMTEADCLRVVAKRLLSKPETAKAALIKAGIYTRHGALSKDYGG